VNAERARQLFRGESEASSTEVLSRGVIEFDLKAFNERHATFEDQRKLLPINQDEVREPRGLGSSGWATSELCDLTFRFPVTVGRV
jgi:hypothetical protein